MSDFFYTAINQLSSVGVADIIDIIIVAFILYYTFKFIRDRRAGKLAVGVIIIVILLVISSFFEMQATNFILEQIIGVGLIAIIIVFQPELRSMLEKMGGESLKGFKGKFDRSSPDQYKFMISEVCVAVDSLSNTRTGALIVIEGTTRLGDVIKTGTILDAKVSSFLIGNIFYDKAPLHDGAVVIRNNKIYAAGCFLPLSTNPDIVKDLGTRHRAAIGMSENSDAVVIVVSEETGIISVAVDGILKRGFSRKTLEEYIQPMFVKGDQKSTTNKIKERLFGKGDETGDEQGSDEE